MAAFWKFLAEDWYFAIPLLLTSFIALTLVFWRLLLNIDARTNLDEFLPVFQEVLRNGGIDGALRMCKARRDLIPSRLYVAGLETAGQGLTAMRRAMAHVIELDIRPELHFLLAPILAIAKIATMLGLLGTVISMINTFDVLGRAEAGQDVSGQAGAIGLALFATALGLVIAIPLVFAHVLFRDWAARFEVKMKSAAQKLLVLMQAEDQTGVALIEPPPVRRAPGASLQVPPPESPAPGAPDSIPNPARPAS